MKEKIEIISNNRKAFHSYTIIKNMNLALFFWEAKLKV